MRTRIVTAMLVACLLLMTGLPGTEKELSEEEKVMKIGPSTTTTSWGVSYDWSDLPDDIKDMTNVDIQQIMDDIEDAAIDEAGIDLELGYDIEGFTHYYVTQAPGSSLEIELADGDDEDVYSVDTTITVRMSMTSTSTMTAMWDDNSDPAFDIDFTSEGSTGFILNIVMKEYYTEDDDYFAGMDLMIDGGLSFGSSMTMDATFTGGGDTLNFDGTSVAMSADMTLNSMTAEWRMGTPSAIYDKIIDGGYDEIYWECDSDDYEWYEDYGYPTEDEWGDELWMLDDCGVVDYTWDASFGYDVSMNDFPAEDLGLTSDQASFSLSDNVVETGSSNGNSVSFHTEIYIDDDDYDVGSKEYVRVEGNGPLMEAIGTVVGEGLAELGEDIDIDDPSSELEDESEDWEDDYDEDDNDAIDIIEEFADSDLGDDMEDFAEEMEDIMEDVEDDAESKYTDAEMYWLIDKDTGHQVSPQLLVEDDNDWVQMIGPDGTGEDSPAAADDLEMDYYEGSAAESKQDDVSGLSMADVYSESKSDDDDMMMYLLIGGIAVGLFALIGIVLLMVRRSNDGDGYQEHHVNNDFNSYESIYGSDQSAMGGMGAPMPAPSAPPGRAPITPQVPAGPPAGMQGQVAEDGFEWVQYPPASGDWYYRDKMTQQWVKHG
ncbi:MAG: hypothetical protein VX320_03095 [Candidatus Thermoplasmatota archaeon]|nr:hypothetical protein [Candidatus Thermoplasmatota archaeon]